LCPPTDCKPFGVCGAGGTPARARAGPLPTYFLVKCPAWRGTTKEHHMRPFCVLDLCLNLLLVGSLLALLTFVLETEAWSSPPGAQSSRGSDAVNAQTEPVEAAAVAEPALATATVGADPEELLSQPDIPEAGPRLFADDPSGRTYLIETARPGTTMIWQGRELAIARLHPDFVVRLANAIWEARHGGLPLIGIESAYRPPAFGIGGFVDKFKSLHTYGLAVDMKGIGTPGSPGALLWHQIAARHGVICPYGPYNRAEWNHCQATRSKVISAGNPLRDTVTAQGPLDLGEMFDAGTSFIENNDIIATDEPDIEQPLPVRAAVKDSLTRPAASGLTKAGGWLTNRGFRMPALARRAKILVERKGGSLKRHRHSVVASHEDFRQQARAKASPQKGAKSPARRLAAVTTSGNHGLN
jgi:hypothetical protein